MHTSPRSVSPGVTSVPPVASSDSSQSVSLKNASHLVLVQVLEGHEDCVRCACFYPDESKLVSGSEDETLRIWDRKTGAPQVLSGHTGVVWDVDVSQDGKMVVSGSGDKTVRTWNGESGETMHLFEGHEEDVRSVKFSPDSSTVVSGSEDKTVRVWSIETGELVFKPIECYGRVFCVGYSPSGDRIVYGADSIQIWNAETGVGILSIRDSSIFSLAWSADGTHIIGGGHGKVTIWNSRDGDQLRTRKAHDR
ncbi:WD40 repeat-like protein [Paxillus ammoniavirescens]|nr:WD40 repeat-like protein [Paxillus ammoniavirescens]